MNLNQRGNIIAGFVTNSGGGNITGYVVDTEAVPLIVLTRRHFNGSYLKSHGVNAYFLGRHVSPGLFNMSFINDYGESCSTVTLTANTTNNGYAGSGSTSSSSIERLSGSNHFRVTERGVPPLNGSWRTKWFKGPKAPFAVLKLQETEAGLLQGSCTAEQSEGECRVVRADQLPRSSVTQEKKRIVQVNARVSGRLIVLAVTFCPGDACGMVQWISGDGEYGQLSLVPSAAPAPRPHVPKDCLHNVSWYAYDLDWIYNTSAMTAKSMPSYTCKLGAIIKRCPEHSTALPSEDIRCFKPGTVIRLDRPPEPLNGKTLTIVEPIFSDNFIPKKAGDRLTL